MKQVSFFKSKDFPKEFGGELLRGKRKSRRPLSTKKAIHTVLRTKDGSKAFHQNRNLIRALLNKYADRFKVRIYKLGLARDHAHLVIKINCPEDYASFVRVVSGVLAKLLHLKWMWRPYTRVLEWGRDFKGACKYTLQNELEALGVVPYRERKRGNRYKFVLSWLSHSC